MSLENIEQNSDNLENIEQNFENAAENIIVDNQENVQEETAQNVNKLPDNNSFIDSMSDADIERLAGEIGWKPNGGKKTAREWLKGTDNYILSTKDALQGLQNQISEMKDAFNNQIKIARNEERKLSENLINTLKQQINEKQSLIEESFDDGDKAAYKKHSSDQKKLEEQLKKEEQKVKQPVFDQQETQKIQEIANRYVQNNPWYTDDEFLQSEMNAEVIKFQSLGKSFEKSLELAEKKLRRAYPEDFQQYEKNKQPETKNTPPSGDKLNATEAKTPVKGSPESFLSPEGIATLNNQMQIHKDIFPSATPEELKIFKQGVIKTLKENPSNFKKGYK